MKVRLPYLTAADASSAKTKSLCSDVLVGQCWLGSLPCNLYNYVPSIEHLESRLLPLVFADAQRFQRSKGRSLVFPVSIRWVSCPSGSDSGSQSMFFKSLFRDFAGREAVLPIPSRHC